jgi:hypothetical protein
MIRTLITPEHTDVNLSIPKTYIGRPLEIILFAMDELSPQPVKTLGDFAGLLSDEDSINLKAHTQQARTEWNRNF